LDHVGPQPQLAATRGPLDHRSREVLIVVPVGADTTCAAEAEHLGHLLGVQKIL